MIKSKRFLLTCIGFLTFIIGVFFCNFEPFNFGSGIAVVLAPYLTVESFRPTKNDEILNSIKDK